MLDSHQIKILTHLYNQFLDSEKKGWTNLDDFLELLEFLDSDQLYREADLLYTHHKNRNMGCPYKHSNGTECFVKPLLEGVEAILNLYLETGNMHPNNRYILQYYLALAQDGQIVEHLSK
jgi:hypothetical protein